MRVFFSQKVSIFYNLFVEKSKPMFNLTLRFTDETLNGFKVTACFR